MKTKLTRDEQISIYFEKILPRINQDVSQAQIAKELGITTDQVYRCKVVGNSILKQAEADGVPPEQVTAAWVKSDNLSYYVSMGKDAQDQQKAFKSFFDKEVKKIKSPRVAKIKRKKKDHLFIYNPTDIHFGKYSPKSETGEGEYNLKIASERLQSLTDRIMDQAFNYDIEKTVLVIGNDIVHVDNPRNTTTSGTPQDTDGKWHEMITTAVENLQLVIEKLKKHSPVHVVFCPSNHDYTYGFCIAQIIEALYRNDGNVTGDYSIKHRKYMQYKKSLIGFTHGDGAKEKDLGQIMAIEARHLWADTERGHWYLGHLHHHITKDYIGYTAETTRSMSGSDTWHDVKGYVGSPRAVEGYIHDERGQVSRITQSI